MGKDWLPIRVKTEQSKMNRVVDRIEGFPEEVMTKYFFQFLQGIAASGADVMRNYIEYNSHNYTPTGQRRADAGGPGPGRRKSGDMIAGIKWSGKKVAPAKYEFLVGWLDGTPGYSVFQEYGTKSGVTAMNSLQYTADFMRREMKLLGHNPAGAKVSSPPGKWGG